eukprot:scaffold1172_cov247-Pinguiococcus_pyrenoidosus.AAC.11
MRKSCGNHAEIMRRRPRCPRSWNGTTGNLVERDRAAPRTSCKRKGAGMALSVAQPKLFVQSAVRREQGRPLGPQPLEFCIQSSYPRLAPTPLRPSFYHRGLQSLNFVVGYATSHALTLPRCVALIRTAPKSTERGEPELPGLCGVSCGGSLQQNRCDVAIFSGAREV